MVYDQIMQRSLMHTFDEVFENREITRKFNKGNHLYAYLCILYENVIVDVKITLFIGRNSFIDISFY